jgi:hypothetical protein
MKKWILLGSLVWGAAGGVRAQDIAAPGAASGRGAGNLRSEVTASDSPDSSDNGFLSAAAGTTSSIGLGGAKYAAAKFARANFGAPVASAAMSAPAPQAIYRGAENDRWELGLGLTYLRFRSPDIHQNMLGLDTEVVYFPSEWFGIEGNITAAFGGTIFANERTKYGGFTGGPKIVLEQKRWEPWVHALVGLAHVNPQLAGVGKNGLAIQLGGGADYRLRGNLAVRIEGDWVLTRLYSLSQNNFQLTTGVVIHF